VIDYDQGQPTGVQNLSSKPQRIIFDGDSFDFGPKEVKILARRVVDHGLRKRVLMEGKDVNGGITFTPTIVFKLVPLEEAMKVAKFTDHPELVKEKKHLDALAKAKQEARAELLAELKAQGLVKDSASAGKLK
jgi:hypothetical protein